MRTVTRDQLLALPAGVLYRERYAGGAFGGLQMKVGACGGNDWFELDLELPVDCEDDCDRYDHLTGSGPFSLDFEAAGRDGAFDDEARYFVYEADDLLGFLRVLARAVPA